MSGAPLRICRPSGRSIPLMRVWAVNSMNRDPEGTSASTAVVRNFTAGVDGQVAVQVDDALSFRRLVGHRGDRRQLAQLGGRVIAQRQKLRRAAVAHRDRARLVQKQRVDVAGHFDRLAALGEHVGPQGPVHAGDADCGQQRADRGRDQAHEKADERRHVGPQALDRLGDAEVRLHVESRRCGPSATRRP